MKKILIVIDNLNTGGIATSLYNFLPQLINNNICCDLLVFDTNSIDRKRIPNGIKILDSNLNLNMLGIDQKKMKTISFLLSVKRAFYVGISKMISGNCARRLLFRHESVVGDYDLAIAYCHDLGWNSFTPGCRQFVFEKVKAKRKAVYIHCDYQKYGGYSIKQLKDYMMFDKILCVSNGCKKSFLNCFPETENKLYSLENFIDENAIRSMGEEAIRYENGLPIFVSVCRLSKEKAIDRTLSVFEQLVSDKIVDFNWIIVGDGPEKERIQQLISQSSLKNKVFLVGQKENPYAYIKNATALLLLSYHEAAPMVYGESQVLGVPVITTNTLSAVELVQERQVGIVCDNDSISIYNVLKNVITNPEILDNYKSNSGQVNKNAHRQLLNLVGEEKIE